MIGKLTKSYMKSVSISKKANAITCDLVLNIYCFGWWYSSHDLNIFKEKILLGHYRCRNKKVDNVMGCLDHK